MRIIKRYGNRKLYDTQESKYVALADLAKLVRSGEKVQVMDRSEQDITAQVLAQIIVEEQKGEATQLPSDFLHQIIRNSGRAVSQGVKQVQTGMEQLVSRGLNKIAPVRQAREEMENLKKKLAEIENALNELEPGDNKESI